MNGLIKALVLGLLTILSACGGGDERPDATTGSEGASITTERRQGAEADNRCLSGDVHTELLGNYLPASHLQTAEREWSAYRGYLAVVGERTIEVSLRFDQRAIDTFKLREDFAFEVDVVDGDNILEGEWTFAHGFPGSIIVKKDVSFMDRHHQLSLLVLRPHELKAQVNYKIRFHLSEPIRLPGRLKLNTDLSVSFLGTREPLCRNPFFRDDDWTSGWNYFKLEIEEYSAFWYTPHSSSGICWSNQSGSSFGDCVDSRGVELPLGNLPRTTDATGDSGLPGPGIPSLALDAPAAEPPDFVVRKAWLETPWGAETYRYGAPETVRLKAQFENTGSGDAPSSSPDIEVHFYLSRGYKQDAHGGDGAWRRVGTDFIKPENLRAGMTHTETEGLELWRDIPEPGIWNVVACIDHYQDDHNNGGRIRERHESNNCSTEAVFEVTTDGQVVNVPTTDLVPSGFRFLQAPIYAGDFARFGATITNRGTARPSADIRSSYSVSCNSGPEVFLTDDNTPPDNLTPGRLEWEETIAPVQLPNTPGNCTAYFRVDYQAVVSESDEVNNVASFTFTLQPRPSPSLVITQFRDQRGCCTTNTGEYIYPDIWIRNDGPVAPGANVRVLYQISSPVGTGGAYITMGHGTIEPRELPPGGTDEDYMDANRWQIPKSSVWRNQWHSVRACVHPQGLEPTGGPGDICAAYARFSKK